MKRVLFITYFWVPSGKATVHLPLRLIKYLPEFGWKPSVLTVYSESVSQKDESLLQEVDPSVTVIKSKANEPFEFYKKFTGRGKEEKLIESEFISPKNRSLTNRIAIWVRMNFFVPDARAGWYFSGSKAGKAFLETNRHDAIISVGPPHTAHLIGMTLSKKFRIPHYPLLIDPWVDIVYYKNFKRSKPTLLIDNFLEKSVLKNSAASIFVTDTTRHDYIRKYDFLKEKACRIYWGYNEEDFINIQKEKNRNFELLVHAGNIFDYQNPEILWKTIRNLRDKGRDIRIKFIGTVSPLVKISVESAGLSHYTEYAGFLPYKQMLNEIVNADYLLMCASEKRHVPGKLFEYLRTGNPIIAFGDDNKEVEKILSEANAGMIFKYREGGEKFFSATGNFNTNTDYVKKFDRKIITEKLNNILEKV